MSEKIGNGPQVDVDTFLHDLKTMVRDGQELLRVGVGTLKQRAKTGVETTQTFVREKPYYSIGAAFGVGVLAGLLVASMFKGASEEED